MILDHYSDETGSQTSYLIACPKTRQAALINPISDCVKDYEHTLSARNLRLVQIFTTQADSTNTKAIAQLGEGRGPLNVFPTSEATIHCATNGHPVSQSAEAPLPGGLIALGELHVAASRAPSNSGDDTLYRVGDYTFTSRSLLIAEPPASEAGEEYCASTNRPVDRRGEQRRVRNFRSSRENVAIEQLLLEDLHTSLIENAFSPKETLVVRAYIELLEENDSAHPSAAELAEKTGGIERSVIHVLVHSIRWKQIDSGRLPLVLAGQASKWLRDLKTEPEFTPHEKEFLCAYLRLVARAGDPPSGPEVATELGSHRSIQWVRKRAFTIRRKQREFDRPLLMLARSKPEIVSTHRPVPMTRRRNQFVIDHLPIA